MRGVRAEASSCRRWMILSGNNTTKKNEAAMTGQVSCVTRPVCQEKKKQPASTTPPPRCFFSTECHMEAVNDYTWPLRLPPLARRGLSFSRWNSPSGSPEIHRENWNWNTAHSSKKFEHLDLFGWNGSSITAGCWNWKGERGGGKCVLKEGDLDPEWNVKHDLHDWGLLMGRSHRYFSKSMAFCFLE